jgi:hypothetical protein
VADRVDRNEYVIQLRGFNRSKPWMDMLAGIKSLRKATQELEERSDQPHWRGRDARIIYRQVKETAMLERKAK